MNILLAMMLASSSSVGVEFRLLDTGDPFRSLERSSLIYGSVEFRIRMPEGIEAYALRILDDSVTARGDEVTLCESPAGGSSCVVRLSHIARRRLRVRNAIPGVGIGPTRTTFIPIEHMPEVRALSSM